MATLAQARLAACDKRKYATYQILSLVPVPKPGIGTMAVDEHWRLYYDPAYLESLTISRAAAVLLHETAHLLFAHHQRAKMLGITAETAQDWNIATDCSINSIEQAEGLDVGEDWMFPAKFGFPDGKAAETYMEMLKQRRQQEQQQAQQQAQQGHDGDESEQGDSDSQDEGRDSDGTGSDLGETDTQSGAVARYPGEGGSCSDGIQRPWEDDPPAEEDEQDGDCDAAPRGVPKWEQDIIREQVARATETFKGNMPCGMLGEIDKILNPRIDPRRLLIRAVRANTDNACRSGGGRFTYRRPARRPSFGGTVRPSSFQPIPRIVVLVDTSGSMDADDLGLALGLVGNVLNGLRLRDGVQVVCADAAIQWAGKVFDPSKIVIAGRGGTEMDIAIESIDQDKAKPVDCIICISDGYTDWPQKPTNATLVVCLTRPDMQRRVPSWADKVLLHSDQDR